MDKPKPDPRRVTSPLSIEERQARADARREAYKRAKMLPNGEPLSFFNDGSKHWRVWRTVCIVLVVLVVLGFGQGIVRGLMG